MKNLSIFVCACALLVPAFAPFSLAQNKAPADDSALPYTPSLDVSAMDRSADPCVDLYQFSCGGWQKNNPIPPDQTSWSVYRKLYQDNVNFLHGTLAHAASDKRTRTQVSEGIGHVYA